MSNLVTIFGVLNACGSVVALGEECNYAHEQRRLELDEIQMSLCGLAWLTCTCKMWEHNQLISLFVYLLSAHYPIGLVYESMQYYGLTIKLHAFCYTCMVDLLGHAGHP